MATTVAIDYGAGISDAWSSIANFVPKLVAFLVILLIGWIIAKVLAKLVTTILRKVGFDRLTERSGLSKVLAKSDYDAGSLLAKVVYYAILLITLQLAIGVFGPNPISDLLTRFVSWLPKLFIAILIIVIVAAIAHAVSDLIRGALGGASYGPLIATIASVFIWGAGIIAALNQIGVATTVTTPVLIAVLATLGGVIVVGVGGGLVKPMQTRWETALDKVSEEIPARRAERAERAAASSRGNHAAQPHPQQQAYSQQQQTAYTQPMPQTQQPYTGQYQTGQNPNPQGQTPQGQTPQYPGQYTPEPGQYGGGYPQQQDPYQPPQYPENPYPENRD
ncbi:mechanosensitive ion channel family protein [Gordonia sp. (in: high G+C Gram-positive bacteria)]|uniref:mechanosensitive ion channel family protein n=1 Tax=Gordonia sp. (in: high G+C Gram-positive bacteria) TaxID=84139 RepID=UPI003F94F4BF